MLFIAVVNGLSALGISWVLARITCDKRVQHRSASDQIAREVNRLAKETTERLPSGMPE